MYLLSMTWWPLGNGSGRMNPLGERRGAAGGLDSVFPLDCFWSSITFFDSRVSLKLTFKGKLSGKALIKGPKAQFCLCKTIENVIIG